MSKITGLPKIINKGTSQKQRYLAHLNPANNKVDDEKMPDLLTFLYQFSRLLNHFDEDQGIGNWSAFFEDSELMKVANIATTNTYYYYDAYQNKRKQFAKGQKSTNLIHLFILQFEMAVLIDSWHQNLGQENELKKHIDKLIKTVLKPALANLFKLANAVTNAGLCQPLQPEVIKYRGYFLDAAQRKTWGLSLRELLLADTAFLTIKSSKLFKYNHAEKLLEDIFYFLNVSLIRTPQEANKIFENTLQYSDTHEPHLTLIFAFIEIYKEVQGDLNRITKRHLDFFYREVLNIKEKESLPDYAHVVFGLSSHIQSHVLEKDTLLAAGDDKNGVPISFSLREEMEVNEVQVKSVATLYLPKPPKPCLEEAEKEKAGEPTKYYLPYFSEIAFIPGAKGLGFDHLMPPGWPALGNRQYGSEGKEDWNPYPMAEMGLMLACGNFNLQEGDRVITISITVDANALDIPIDILKKAIKTEYGIDKTTLENLEKNGVVTAGFPIDLLKDKKTFWTNDEQFLKELNEEIKKFNVKEFPPEKKVLFLKHAWRNNLFNLFYSAEEGWNMIKEVEVTVQEENKNGDGYFIVHIKAHLGAAELPFIPNGLLYPYPFAKKFPLLKIMFVPEFKANNISEFDNNSLYYYFRQLKIADVKTDVHVTGLKKMVVQNDEGLQDVNSTVLPFGIAPKKGADFYMGGMEVYYKNLIDLKINLHWEELPESFADHYLLYGKKIKWDMFKVEASMLQNKSWKKIKDANLFQEKIPKGSAGNRTVDEATQLHFTIDDFKEFYATDPEVSDQFTINSTNGYFRLRLGQQDFLNDLYSQAVVLQASAIAAQANGKIVASAIYKKIGNEKPEEDQTDGADNVESPTVTNNAGAATEAEEINSEEAGKEDKIFKTGGEIDKWWRPDKATLKNYIIELPKEPYLPRLSSIDIEYQAQDSENDILLFHIYPHENTFKEIEVESEPTFLPLFEQEGTLYIGLEKAMPGSQLNLLFQIAESTGNPDSGEAKVRWEYLVKNKWKPLRKDFEVLSDETMGLINSGIIKFSLPRKIKNDNTCLPTGLYWIKAACDENANAVSKVVAVHAQAAKVVFEKQPGSDFSRFGMPLPAGSITELQKVDSSIDSLVQPFDAFGGRPEEATEKFYIRVSEHLRHKGRAVTEFDYERLVLEEFPELHLVKCINHTLGRDDCNRTIEVSPGHVAIAVIPDITQQKNANRLTPKIPLSKLKEIEKYLKSKISPFVRLQVLNPKYEPVNTKFNVQFNGGKSPAHYANNLEDRIKQFLSPWAFEDSHAISFGNSLEQSAIIEFIEKEPYVDYIKNFEFIWDVEKIDEPHIVNGSTPLSVLYSGTHEILDMENEKYIGTVP